MVLGSEARARLFGTPVKARQMVLFVQGHGSVTMDEIRQVFPEMRSNALYKCVRQLVAQGSLERDGEILRSVPDARIPGDKADRVWKAAQILKEFDLDKLAMTSDVGRDYVQRILGRWNRAGLAVKTVREKRGCPARWRFVGDGVRPVEGMGR